jgi:hypothetical protein
MNFKNQADGSVRATAFLISEKAIQIEPLNGFFMSIIVEIKGMMNYK